MTFMNQFHKEAVERKIRKITELRKVPMKSEYAAKYMKRNLEIAESL